jgi:hypothetical protein
VLKVQLENHVTPKKLNENKIPQKFLTNEKTAKDDFLNELSSYLQKIKLDAEVSEEFI